ncbi:MAG: GGDEF domain-containing protein [Porticoccaceae bacterium]
MSPVTPSQRHRPAPASGAAQRELMLSQALQTTLELDRLVALFGAEIGKDVAHDGLRYWHAERDLECSLGEKAANTCSYRLRIDGEDLGELTFSRRRRFAEAELVLIETRLSSLLYPLRNALKYRAAVDASSYDYLTGAFNRRALDIALLREIRLVRRHGFPLSLVMLDIDRFKDVNTRHGHVVGDRVIQRMVACIRSGIRSSDLLFRYGGEEFVLLLSNTHGDGALHLAEKIRVAVADLRHQVEGDDIAITLSLGVASHAPGDDVQQLLVRADAALRDAKHRGRNRVLSAPSLFTR